MNIQLVKNQSNLKRTWKLIRGAINRKPKLNDQSISCILVDDALITNPNLMANKFNEFFTTEPSHISEKIPKVDVNPNLNEPDGPIFSLSDNRVSEEEIYKAVDLLQPKRSYDCNDVSMFFLKKCIPTFMHQLKYIISLSFNTGQVPDQLKIAKVIPIFKSGDPRILNNYRPISLLNNFSKIFEKVMYLRLTNFLEVNNLISNSQYGFRQNHSTIHPLIQLSNFISKSFNEKKHVLGIFCDLSKAFDTVDHSILLQKLSKIGIRGMELSWFSNYLTNRKQFVRINNCNSSLLDVLIGVPQGSILGPLLFFDIY